MAVIIPFPMHRAGNRPSPRLHIWRAGEAYELHHESRSGDSWAFLGSFPSREDALQAAAEALPTYPGTTLATVAQ